MVIRFLSAFTAGFAGLVMGGFLGLAGWCRVGRRLRGRRMGHRLCGGSHGRVRVGVDAAGEHGSYGK